jgi:hypothetical protein
VETAWLSSSKRQTPMNSTANKSKNTVIKYVGMLEEKGLISKHKTFVITDDGKAWNGNLMFTIAPIRSAIDVHYYHQMWDRKNIQYIKQPKRKKRR